MPRPREHPLNPAQPTAKTAADGKTRNLLVSPDAMATTYNPGDGSRRLKNSRHEQVARAVGIRGATPAEAVREVYDPAGKWTSKRALNEGTRICQATPSVVARIHYLTNLVISRDIEVTVTSREWIEAEMVKTYRESCNDGAWQAAVKVLELLGVDKGMFIRRSQIEHHSKPIEAHNREELVAQIVQLARDALGPLDTGALRLVLERSAAGKSLPAEIEVKALEDMEPAGSS